MGIPGVQLRRFPIWRDCVLRVVCVFLSFRALAFTTTTTICLRGRACFCPPVGAQAGPRSLTSIAADDLLLIYSSCPFLSVCVCVSVFVCRAVSLMTGGPGFTRRLPGEGLRELELDVCVVSCFRFLFFVLFSFLSHEYWHQLF